MTGSLHQIQICNAEHQIQICGADSPLQAGRLPPDQTSAPKNQVQTWLYSSHQMARRHQILMPGLNSRTLQTASRLRPRLHLILLLHFVNTIKDAVNLAPSSPVLLDAARVATASSAIFFIQKWSCRAECERKHAKRSKVAGSVQRCSRFVRLCFAFCTFCIYLYCKLFLLYFLSS